jgi:hypothetical protein
MQTTGFRTVDHVPIDAPVRTAPKPRSIPIGATEDAPRDHFDPAHERGKTMTTTITSSPRRSIAAWVPAAALIVLLIGILVSSGARLTWEVPTATVLPARTTTRPSAVTVERAERLSAVRHELTVLRAAGQQIPAIRFGCTTGARCWRP